MTCSNRRRTGATLIEVLVGTAIVAVLVGLLLVAVQSVRLSAARVVAVNNAKQVVLATHAFANANGDALPNIEGLRPNQGYGVGRALNPYLETNEYTTPACVRLPSDPSRGGDPAAPPVAPPASNFPVLVDPHPGSSFAFNALVYKPDARLDTAAPDGRSATIALTEHYSVCGGTAFHWAGLQMICKDETGRRVPCGAGTTRRPTFADGPDAFTDVYPVTAVRGGVPVTVGSQPLTFQVRPPLSECDPRVPNSSLPGGVLAGWLDGSVRFVRAGVDPAAFWGSVTPAGGESAGVD